MDEQHYRGAPWKISQTVWYVANDDSGAWPALAAFSAAALKCSARDAWFGWCPRDQHGQLHLVANNVRLLLLGRRPNLGSRFPAPGASSTGMCANALSRSRSLLPLTDSAASPIAVTCKTRCC